MALLARGSNTHALICTTVLQSATFPNVLQGPMLQENADLHIPTGAGSLTSRGNLMSKGVLEFSIWQESPLLAFPFLKESGSFPYPFIPAPRRRILPFDSPSDTSPQPLATHSVPAWKSSSL